MHPKVKSYLFSRYQVFVAAGYGQRKAWHPNPPYYCYVPCCSSKQWDVIHSTKHTLFHEYEEVWTPQELEDFFLNKINNAWYWRPPYYSLRYHWQRVRANRWRNSHFVQHGVEAKTQEWRDEKARKDEWRNSKKDWRHPSWRRRWKRHLKDAEHRTARAWKRQFISRGDWDDERGLCKHFEDRWGWD